MRGPAFNPGQLADRLLDFSASVGAIVDALPDTRMGRHIAGQLVRCGTAAAPNYEEGCAAESRNDFIHKLSVALKEMRESRSWLRLIAKCNLIPKERIIAVLDESDQLCRILAQSIVTAKRNKDR